MNETMLEDINAYLRSKGLPEHIAVTFEDVYIVDRLSDIASRSDITDLGSRLAAGVSLNVPLVSANMPDVTGADMAITLARLGGCGFLHQFAPIESRVEEVRRVKRAESSIIEQPITITPFKTLEAAKELISRYEISGLLVVDDEVRLVGILTSRDIRFQEDADILVRNLMTPLPLIIGNPDTDREQAKRLLIKNKIEKLPLVDKEGRVAGLITAKDILTASQYTLANRDQKGRLVVGATVGVSSDIVIDEIGMLIDAGADVILVDTARAFATAVRDLVIEIKRAYPSVPLVVGNIDRPEAAIMLIIAGADAIKVGIGPGSACKTREETGVGTPQLTAIAKCVAVANRYDIPVIADGGIDVGADLVKALVAGASSVMLGSALSGTSEAPGRIIFDDGIKWKMYSGLASVEAQMSRMESGGLERVRPSEGIQRRVRYKGEVQLVIENFMGHLRSAMSYTNAHNLKELRDCVFEWQTRAGYIEGRPIRE